MNEEMNRRALLGKLMRLQGLLQREHVRRHGERGPFADPTRGQGRVLALLKMQEEVSTRDLSYLLDIRQQSLSELLAKLERAGYVERAPLESDRRMTRVRLTQKGREAQQEEPGFTSLLDCLTPEEQSTLDGYLDRMLAKAEAELGADGQAEDRWMERARSRMGDDAFEHLMNMRGRGFAGPEGRRFGERCGREGRCEREGRFRPRPDEPNA